MEVDEEGCEEDCGCCGGGTRLCVLRGAGLDRGEGARGFCPGYEDQLFEGAVDGALAALPLFLDSTEIALRWLTISMNESDSC